MSDRIDMAGADVPEATCKRDRARDSLLLAAQLLPVDGDATFAIRVRNLSAGGLMAEADHAVAAGDRIQIEMRSLGTVAGTVAWTEPGRLGIAFDEPIDPRQARRPVGSKSAETTHLRPLVYGRRPGLHRG